MTAAIVAHELRKTFAARRRQIEAVRGIDLRVSAGEVFAFLGPNGAGKTTTVRMLTTLLPIDSGTAFVAGVDVDRDPVAARRRIGLVGQRGGADLAATGRENLLLQGQLYGSDRATAERRAAELIELFALGEFVDRRAQTYSGGQRRRLELALGLMHNPRVLFLDEPTTGLDPHNRANLWEQIRTLRESGTTIFLTTHYLEEADALANRVAIVDHGRVVAEGTPAELKRELGSQRIRLTPKADGTPIEEIAASLRTLPLVEEAQPADGAIRLTVADGARVLPALLDRLRERRIELDSLTLAEPSLDDVFLAKTGRALRDTGDLEQAP